MIKNIFTLIIIALSFGVFAQNNFKQGYIISDSTYSSGDVSMGTDFSNARECVFFTGQNTTRTYSPSELLEYMVDDRKYVSVSLEFPGIPFEDYFLEELIKDSVSLYYLKMRHSKLFFILKDSSDYILLTKDNFKNVLNEEFKDYSLIKDDIDYIKFKEKQLKWIVNKYNSQYNINESLKPLPFFRFGINSGFYNVKGDFIVRDMASLPTTSFSVNSFIVGINYAYQLKNLSFNTEINYSNILSKTYSEVSNPSLKYNYDVFINYSYINIPFIIKYNLFGNRTRPYLSSGIEYNRFFLTDIDVFEAKIDQNEVNFKEYENINIAPDYFGLIVGAGLIYNISRKRAVFLESRYKLNYSITKTPNKLNSSLFCVKVGLYF